MFGGYFRQFEQEQEAYKRAKRILKKRKERKAMTQSTALSFRSNAPPLPMSYAWVSGEWKPGQIPDLSMTTPIVNIVKKRRPLTAVDLRRNQRFNEDSSST